MHKVDFSVGDIVDVRAFGFVNMDHVMVIDTEHDVLLVVALDDIDLAAVISLTCNALQHFKATKIA